MELEWINLVELLAAVAAGTLIGLERELAAKPAGLRTNIMICLGAALFTIMSVKLSARATVADPARIAAQIVTGVGFLGAGAIIHTRRSVVGLTTAATIWVDASVGMAFGAGEFVLGAVGTILTSGVLFGLESVEAWLARWRAVARFEVELDLAAHAGDVIEKLARQAGVQWKTFSVSKTPEALVGRFKAEGPEARLKALQRALLLEEKIIAVRRM